MQSELQSASMGKSMRETSLQQEIAVLRANVEDLTADAVRSRLAPDAEGDAEAQQQLRLQLHALQQVCVQVPQGTLVLDPLKKYFKFFVTSACARRTGAAARVERRRREPCALLAVRGRRASRSDTRVARQAFERMHKGVATSIKSQV